MSKVKTQGMGIEIGYLLTALDPKKREAGAEYLQECADFLNGLKPDYEKVIDKIPENVKDATSAELSLISVNTDLGVMEMKEAVSYVYRIALAIGFKAATTGFKGVEFKPSPFQELANQMQKEDDNAR